jgi:hypothetical protein
MSDERTKRRAPVSYRIPKEHEALFDSLVAEHGGSVGALVTAAILAYAGAGKPRRNRAERKQLAQLLASAARISDQLHETALTGAGESTLTMEAAHRELTEIRAALMVLMGRKP